MSAQITVERNFNLDDVVLFEADDFRDLGLMVREVIYRRTVSGIDADGRPFAPYSKQYAKQKAALDGGGTVNLQVSGNMLNHMQIIEIEVGNAIGSVTLGWEQ